jgi:hypothetical protein
MVGVGVLVADGVDDGVNVTVGELVLVAVNVGEGVSEAVNVADGVEVSEGVTVGVGVVVGVGVGVFVTVPVMTNGVRLRVGLGTVPVGVMEGVRDWVAVWVNCRGFGRSDKAIKPRQ